MIVIELIQKQLLLLLAVFSLFVTKAAMYPPSGERVRTKDAAQCMHRRSRLS